MMKETLTQAIVGLVRDPSNPEDLLTVGTHATRRWRLGVGQVTTIEDGRAEPLVCASDGSLVFCPSRGDRCSVVRLGPKGDELVIHHDRFVNSVAVGCGDRLVALYCGPRAMLPEKYDGQLEVYHLGDAKKLSSFPAELTHVLFHPFEGDVFGSVYRGAQVVRLEAKTGHTCTKFDLPANAACMALSQDGARLAVATFTKTIVVFDALSGANLNAITRCGVPTCIEFSRDGRTLATGDKKGQVSIFDVETGKRLSLLKGHVDKVSSVVFLGDLVASACWSGSWILWDVDAKRPRFMGLTMADDPAYVVVDLEGTIAAPGGKNAFRFGYHEFLPPGEATATLTFTSQDAAVLRLFERVSLAGRKSDPVEHQLRRVSSDTMAASLTAFLKRRPRR